LNTPTLGPATATSEVHLAGPVGEGNVQRSTAGLPTHAPPAHSVA
jgi:hypothetical protein